MPIKKTVANRVPVSRAAKRFLDDRRRANLSAQTIHWYEQKLSQLGRTLGAEYIDQITRERVEAFLDGLEAKGRSRDYLRGWHQVFRTFIGHCVEEGWAVAPDLVRPHAVGTKWFAIKKPKAVETPVEAYTNEQVALIIEAADSPRNRAIVKIYVNTGLRRSELANLKVDDVDFERHQIRVLRKGRRWQSVKMSVATAQVLGIYMRRWRNPKGTSEHVFLTRDGKHGLTVSAISAIFQRIKKDVGFRAHPHALRHTFATNYVKDGGQALILQQRLGHSNPRMTQRYLHWAGEDVPDDLEKVRQF